MKKYMLLLVSVALIGCFNRSYGQSDYKPGYIITNNNDTVHGFIDLKANNINSYQCVFAVNENADAKNYSPSDIKGYRIENSKFYISKEVALADSFPEKLFLEYLVNGIADLYYLKQGAQDFYFLEKNGEMYRLSNEERTVNYTPKTYTESLRYASGEHYVQHSNKYIGMLSIAFSDCPELSNQINNVDFGYNQLIRITKDYHNKVCPDYQCIDYSKSTKTKLYIEPYIGGIYSILGLKTSEQSAKDASFMVGFGMRILPNKSHYLWNLIIGADYSKISMDNTLFIHDLVDETGEYVSTYIEASYSMLRLPISIEYTFPTGKLKPFLRATYTNALLLNAEADVSSYDDYNFRELNFGIGAGLGLKYSIGDAGYGILKCEYEYRRAYSQLSSIYDYLKTNSIILVVGYGFRLK